MNVYKHIEEIPFQKETCLTVGTFDGIHTGHRKILNYLVECAAKNNARSLLVTFYPHPKTVISREHGRFSILTPLEEKIELLKGTGLDSVLVLPFTQEMAVIKPEEFVVNLLVKSIGVKEIVIGFNHAFGHGRKGNADLLQKLKNQHDFSVEVIKPIYFKGEIISSTKIRNCLLEGNVLEANRLLGRNYRLSGIVKKGKNIGKKLGFPTANLEVSDSYKLIPGDGVYAVKVILEDKRFWGMANIGVNPTLQRFERLIEVHIHHFNGECYDKNLQIEFLDRMRDEKKFDSVDDLIAQIKIDKKKSIGMNYE